MDIGTSNMDRGTSAAGLVPNSVVRDLRTARGWGRPRLARELHSFCIVNRWSSPGEANLAKQIYRIETGRVRAPDEFYTRLYCQFFQKTAHELFGRIGAVDGDRTDSGYRIRSHKFVPAYVGADAVEKICSAHSLAPVPEQWVDCSGVDWERGSGSTRRLYAWPFGVVMYHIAEELTPASVSEVAVWRQISYRENIDWAASRFEEMAGRPLSDEPYVLSLYWVESTPWDDARRDTALRLLCIPRTLIERDENKVPSQAHAALVEQELLREGFSHPGIVDFGIKGIATGFASWSGVVYCPHAPDRALSERELIQCELTVQAVWAYCNYLRSEVEAGSDPLVPSEYGWRFLRGLRSRLTTERPQETSQHRSMREAIVETSGLARHLTQAVETLREVDGGRV